MNTKVPKRFIKAGIEIPESFFEAGVIEMLDSDNVYEWNGKKYSFLGCSFGPTITMAAVGDVNDTIAFDITSELKNELVVYKIGCVDHVFSSCLLSGRNRILDTSGWCFHKTCPKNRIS